MLSFLRDTLSTIQLKARYQRLVHERLISFTESGGPLPVAPDPGDWMLLGDAARGLDETRRTDARTKARHLVLHNPHARNILRLLESYVAGPGLKLDHRLRDSSDRNEPSMSMAHRADVLWREFLAANETHYSYREHARRSWRDGECFIRRFASPEWPPAVRFIDPEAIAATTDEPDSQGILTDPQDVETPIAYLRGNVSDDQHMERIDAREILHTRIGVDSNQKRGVTIFLPVLNILDCFDKWVETELLARKLQSSIVLWRKVQGSPQRVSALADAAAAGSPGGGYGDGRRERIQPGTILTTNHATEIQYLQPNTNFGDAVPLGRMLLLCASAGAGLPEFMLTSDASNANFASTMVAEGPAVKLFQSEQQFFAAEFTRLWRWIMSEAVSQGRLPGGFFERIEPQFSFPQLVNRDRPRERMADVRLVESEILSRAEVARRDGADPQVMRTEIAGER
jgi:capsid protein